MVRHPEHPRRAGARLPGHELQHRFATAEPDAGAARGRRGGAAPRASSSDATHGARHRQQGKRLPPEIFDLPVEKMREGYYTDAYFNHTRAALLADGRHPRVVMQVFQKHEAVLGGMDEAIAILKLCSDDWDALTVHALYDGDRIEPWETVMTIEGDYTLFAHLETVYLGVLARRTLISTNVDARARGGERQADHLHAGPARPSSRADRGRVCGVVAGALVGAQIGVTTDAQASWWGGRGLGTVPHALIAAYGGNTVLAATKFAEWAPPDLNIVVLVDFENDSVRTALEVARALGPALGRAARHLRPARRPLALGRDGRLRPARRERAARPEGAGRPRRRRLRAREDRRLGRVRRRADPRVRGAGVPVDAYGVGSSLIRGENDFTGDIVLTDGRAVGQGRPRLPAEPAARARRVAARVRFGRATRATSGARHLTSLKRSCPSDKAPARARRAGERSRRLPRRPEVREHRLASTNA